MDTFWDWTYIILRLGVEGAYTHPWWTLLFATLTVVECCPALLVRAYLAVYLRYAELHLDYTVE